MRKLVVVRGEVQVKDVYRTLFFKLSQEMHEILAFWRVYHTFLCGKSGSHFQLSFLSTFHVFGHQEPADPYWKQVRYLFLQMWGLKARVPSAC